FSANVSYASLGSSVTLRGNTGAVDGTLTVTGATATFTPSAPLPLACVENAQVAASAADTTGQALGKAYRWQFTTADGAWASEQSVSGATYTDGGVYYSAGDRVAIAADGSAFTSWTAYDPSRQHLYLHASRYTPAGGWAPHLQFDELLQDGRYGGGSMLRAVSANGEAMFLWSNPAFGDAGAIVQQMRSIHYGPGWGMPTTVESDAAPVAIGADANGNFIATWVGTLESAVRTVRMARFAHGTGWGPVESPASLYTGGSATYSPQTITLATASDGHAIAAWIEGSYGGGGPWWIRAERYVPATGWSGPETLASGSTPLGSSAVVVAAGSDGSAAVLWRQSPDPSTPTLPAHVIAKTFSVAWSAATTVDSSQTGVGVNGAPLLATDGSGTFMTIWEQRDAATYQVHASRRPKTGGWSTPALIAPVAIPTDGGAAPTEIPAGLAMGASGDAVVALQQYAPYAGTYGLGAATYTSGEGWDSAPSLQSDVNGVARPLIDACGNATLVWMKRVDGSVWTSRHVRGGTWNGPSRIDLSNLAVTNALVCDAIGPSGEVIASWQSGQGYSMAAATFR
ncbi:MAG: Ig-like domain-containing protein, partial [Polyangiaceae bacterium]